MPEHWISVGDWNDAFRCAGAGEWEVVPELRKRIDDVNPAGEVHVQHSRCGPDHIGHAKAWIVFDDKADAIQWRLLYGGDYEYVDDYAKSSMPFSVRLSALETIENWAWIARWLTVHEIQFTTKEHSGDIVFQFVQLQDAMTFRTLFI